VTHDDAIPFFDDDTADAEPIERPPCIIYCGKDGRYEAIVDEDDYAYLMQWRWNYKISSSKHSHRVYARRGGGRGNGGKGDVCPTILMHVEILNRAEGPKPYEGATGDHKNCNTLDNRRENLRWASRNVQNGNQKRWKKRGKK